MIVVAATTQHGDAFCHRYLHAVDVVAVPRRLENRVGEPKNQQILDHPFAQVMVDPVDLALVENLRHSVIQFDSCFQIGPEWRFNHDPASTAVAVGNPRPQEDSPLRQRNSPAKRRVSTACSSPRLLTNQDHRVDP